jgi:hypothetical protein
MGFLDFVVGSITGHSLSDISFCNEYFPKGVEKISLRDGTREVVTGYQAVREIQRDLGREFGNGFAAVAFDLRKSGAMSGDLQYLYKGIS